MSDSVKCSKIKKNCSKIAAKLQQEKPPHPSRTAAASNNSFAKVQKISETRKFCAKKPTTHVKSRYADRPSCTRVRVSSSSFSPSMPCAVVLQTERTSGFPEGADGNYKKGCTTFTGGAATRNENVENIF